MKHEQPSDWTLSGSATNVTTSDTLQHRASPNDIGTQRQLLEREVQRLSNQVLAMHQELKATHAKLVAANNTIRKQEQALEQYESVRLQYNEELEISRQKALDEFQRLPDLESILRSISRSTNRE
ncbi:hypothetical protein CVT24_012074 [Panaeolus cyanescens]|uniref:Uncharacterized protein n=1 Tax=Panaeolus cyanescens TaxID=181874 RepID=A0A409YNH3_9AGAR|nr:hypothetical protein CVT24_012074 [Panaeolus cyanescens]